VAANYLVTGPIGALAVGFDCIPRNDACSVLQRPAADLLIRHRTRPVKDRPHGH